LLGVSRLLTAIFTFKLAVTERRIVPSGEELVRGCGLSDLSGGVAYSSSISKI
jgi:hypothetical protein